MIIVHEKVLTSAPNRRLRKKLFGWAMPYSMIKCDWRKEYNEKNILIIS